VKRAARITLKTISRPEEENVTRDAMVSVLLLFITSTCLFGQDISSTKTIPVWVFFRDRGFADQQELVQALEIRESQLSEKVLRRRAKTLGDTPVLPGDLPLNTDYVEGVLGTGCGLRRESRWLNAVSVEAPVGTISDIAALPYVVGIQRIARLGRIEPLESTTGDEPDHGDGPPGSGNRLDYGPSYDQLQFLNVPAVHDSGYYGTGIVILVLDTGFLKEHESLSGLDIIAEWDFVFDDGETQNEPEDDPSQHNHGTTVWSILGGYAPGSLIGPAFNASFLLAKVEDIRSETPVEEDNYVAALEWADTLGVDITSASLAYLDFDDPYPDYEYSDLDGNTAVITVAVDEAARRGVLVCNAIGNRGPDPGSLWTPADADSIIAVGGVEPSGEPMGLSSKGPTYDGRIKPEMVAMGDQVYGADVLGGYGSWTGTSVATPLISGSAALILEAHPDWTPMQIREALMSTANQASAPDNSVGSGIPDIWSAIYEEGIELHPSSFSLVSPARGDTVSAYDIEFSWTESVDPNNLDLWYKVMIAPDTFFVDPIVMEDIPGTSHTLSDTLGEGLYYWKVYSYNSQGIYTKSNQTLPFIVESPDQTVSVMVVPDDDTFPQGGTLGYTVTVTNLTMNPVSVEGWAEVTIPGGGEISPILGPVEFTLGPEITIDRHITQAIPPNAPLGGPYQYCIEVGQFPASVIDRDCFEFDVVPPVR
jgi:hypothetical protein